jgi:hypothetical protein
VVSQPFDRQSEVPAPGPLDQSLGEFWVENPWDISAQGHNLSSFERNRTFLNVQGRGFLEISHLTGADSDGDGRSVVAADFRNTGQLDLVVRQVGGGSFFLFESQFPPRHYLKVSLKGTKSNRQGIGARIVAEAGGQKFVRELYPHNSFRSQQPAIAHFGLGHAAQIDRLTIHWPSGLKTELTNMPADRHIVVMEEKDPAAAVAVVQP